MTEPKMFFVYVREGATDAIVAKVDVTGRSTAYIDGVVDGFSAFIDRTKHYIDDAETITYRLSEVRKRNA